MYALLSRNVNDILLISEESLCPFLLLSLGKRSGSRVVLCLPVQSGAFKVLSGTAHGLNDWQKKLVHTRLLADRLPFDYYPS